MINAAALLYVSGRAGNLVEGVELARESVRSGKALEVVGRYREVALEEIERLNTTVAQWGSSYGGIEADRDLIGNL